MSDCSIFAAVCTVFLISFSLTSTQEFIPNDGDVEDVKAKGNYLFVEDNDVLVLTRENFHHGIATKPLLLVMFYAPWCDNSKQLAPEFAKAASQLKKGNIVLAKVDGTKEGELVKEFMITGYPSLVLFRNGNKVEEYFGARNAESITKFMRERADPNWQPPTSAAVILTASNFTNFVKHASIAIVKFYAPWCKHSKQMEPEYEAAARTLQKYGIPLAKVNGVEEKELADTYKIPGWPTLKVFRNGRAFDYKGPRENLGIVEYVRDLAKPPSLEVRSVVEAKNGMERTEATIIGFFPEKTDLYHEYMNAAEELRGIFTFMHTFDGGLAESFNVSSNSIVVFQPEIFHSEFEEPYYVYNRASGNVQDIIEFIQAVSVPVVGQRTKRNEAFKYSTRPIVVVYYDVNFDHQYVTETQYIRKKVLQIAKDYRQTNVKFAISDEEEYSKELQGLNLADVTEDVKVAAFETKVKFRMDPKEDFEAEHLNEFVTTLAAGKGKPFFKSQPIPKKQDGPVRVIVADTFTPEVLKTQKDVLLEFYAPWCGHCKTLEPVYNKLARKMSKENPNLVVAKMDATANDIHPMFGELRGYPSIFFIPAFNKDDIVPYQGQLAYKNLKEFVEENSSLFLTEEERLGLAKTDDSTQEAAEKGEQTIKEEL